MGRVEANTAAAERTGHPFLSGVHAPMAEEVTLFELEVAGALPPELRGRYLRMGPNPVAADPDAYHWFGGDGMVHGMAIADGRARWYRNRWIRSDRVAAALGVKPAPGPRRGSGVVNTNVVGIGGRVLALVEGGPAPVELGPTLGEQRYDAFDGRLRGSFAAHPHRDPRTGEHHAICYEGRDPERVRHVVVDDAGRLLREEPVAVRHGPMIHDCALTERFVVILDLPVCLSPAAARAGDAFPFRWNPGHPARVGLLPRNGGGNEVIWCAAPPGFAFHACNAFEEADGTVVLDLCAYEDMFGDARARGPDARARGLERWVVDPAARTVEVRTLDPRPQDFPRHDERFTGRAYRRAWTMATGGAGDPPGVGTALYAHDLLTGDRRTHAFGTGKHPGEFVFVPRTADAPEGDGWMLGFVLDAVADRSELVVLDAQRFGEEPVARVGLPHRVPPGFHGNWIAGGTA